jgi:hypothetical protein
MKTFLACALVIASVGSASAQYLGSGSLSGTGSNPNSHYVSPYTRSNGTTVPGHYQTNPNSTQRDNYGTQGNMNPYTGAAGRRGAQF